MITEPYRNWKTWIKDITDLKGDWLYRGQASELKLETSLERVCLKSGFTLDNAGVIETQMIRQFKRVYDGKDRDEVNKDTSYCLSLMRHYGAPVRLLDFTYSKYVAIYFALEAAFENVPKSQGEHEYKERRSSTVWCIKQEDLLNEANNNPDVKRLIKDRRDDKNRTDTTFRELYLNNKYTFVVWENPLKLHSRLHLQQGTFLCPGNVKKTMMDNIKDPYGMQDPSYIKKFTCSLTPLDLQECFEEFMRMDITRESLFPGLDGLGTSMRYQIWLYKKLDTWINKEKS